MKQDQEDWDNEDEDGEDWGDEDDWDITPGVKSPDEIKIQKENIFATDKSQLPYQFIKAADVIQN